MKIKSIISITLSVLLTVSALTGCSKQSFKVNENVDAIENKKYEGYIKNVDEYLKKCDFYGSVLVTDGEEIILAKGYGYADQKTESLNTMKTTFEIGSMSKQFTAVGILQLQEKDLLSVDDTLDKYFPDFENGKKLTIKNLLQMRSGLYDCIDDIENFYPEDAYKELDEKQNNEIDVPRDFVVKYLNHAGFSSAPDKSFFYCNTNFLLLSLIIEKVSGMTFEDYMQENIFKPCNMTWTNCDFKGTTAKGYDAKGNSLSIIKNICLGAGCINSNVIDIYKWNLNLVNCKIISEESLKEMSTPNQGGYGYGIFSSSGTLIHGGSTYDFNSYNTVTLKDGTMAIVLDNRPIELSSSTAICSNLTALLREYNSQQDKN